MLVTIKMCGSGVACQDCQSSARSYRNSARKSRRLSDTGGSRRLGWEPHGWSGRESGGELARADEKRGVAARSWEEGGGAASAGEAELAVRDASPPRHNVPANGPPRAGSSVFNHPLSPARTSASTQIWLLSPCGIVARLTCAAIFSLSRLIFENRLKPFIA